MHVEISLSLCLPRDELSVPVARHICRNALREVGVVRDSIDDIELALTEACTNVLDHSAADDEYEVKIGINDRVCAIRVRDRGRGFDFASLERARSDLVSDAESGRGIALINALVDRVKFTAKPEAGTIVHLEKELDFEEDSPVRRRMAEEVALAREREA
jgi:serine/threonine-protein kinase RsbW